MTDLARAIQDLFNPHWIESIPGPTAPTVCESRPDAVTVPRVPIARLLSDPEDDDADDDEDDTDEYDEPDLGDPGACDWPTARKEVRR